MTGTPGTPPGWPGFVSRYRTGDVVDGTVTKLLPFGAFVEVADGVVGLLTGDAVSTGDARPQVGARIAVRIREFDSDRHRVSLRAAPDVIV
jgi:ribosomal protein S1